MQNLIFVNSFTKLGSKSRKRFQLFLESPYFNKNKSLIEAIQLMDGSNPRNDAIGLKKELFETLFPGKEYDDSKIRYILSDLTTLLKKFIALEFDQCPPIQRQYELVKQLGKLQMKKLYKQEWNKLGKSIDAPRYQNEITQYYTYQYHIEAQEQIISKSRKGYTYLEQASFNLEAHFVASTLKLACLHAGHLSKEEKGIDKELLDVMLQKVEEGKFDSIPSVKIYYYAYQMQLYNEETYYFKLSNWLDENWLLFPTHETEDIYLLGINFCISKINAGDRTFMKQAFDLYKQGLKNKVFLKDGFLSIHNYKNILRLGMTQKAYEWTESFLYEFKDWLPKEERENAFNYNLAYYYFHKEDYDNCMDLLRTVRFKDVFNNLDARRMLLRIYYEQEEWNALDSHLDSFQSFVMRQKNIGYHKSANLNLVKITRMMMKKFPLSKKSKAQVEKRIKNAEHLAEKNWVIKVAAL